MPTPNQQLVDEQIQRQEDEKASAAAIALTAIALMDDSEPQLRVILERYLSLLTRPGVDLGSPAIQAQIGQMRQDILLLRATAMDRVDRQLSIDLLRETEAEWDFLAALYGTALGITLVRPATTAFPSIRSAAFLGRDLETWLTDLAVADANRISDQVVIGLIRQAPREQILRAVLGEQNFDGNNGATQVTRNDLTGIVVSATFAVLVQAKKQMLDIPSNNEQLPRELYVAVLDNRTTAICRSLNGKVFPVGSGPYPPLHWNCRSTRVPLPPQGEVPQLP
jgi:SPP1 gp7 family putative phage head morphogenesis protein